MMPDGMVCFLLHDDSLDDLLSAVRICYDFDSCSLVFLNGFESDMSKTRSNRNC